MIQLTEPQRIAIAAIIRSFVGQPISNDMLRDVEVALIALPYVRHARVDSNGYPGEVEATVWPHNADKFVVTMGPAI